MNIFVKFQGHGVKGQMHPKVKLAIFSKMFTICTLRYTDATNIFTVSWGQRSTAPQVLKLAIFSKTVDFLYRHMHLKVLGTDGRNIFVQFQGLGVKGQWHPKVLKLAIFSTTVHFLYRLMHLTVVGTDARNIFAQFQDHALKGKRSTAHLGTKFGKYYIILDNKRPMGLNGHLTSFVL